MCRVRVAQCMCIAKSGSESQTSIERAPIFFVLGCAAPTVPGVSGVSGESGSAWRLPWQSCACLRTPVYVYVCLYV